jgi:hypothetical protein
MNRVKLRHAVLQNRRLTEGRLFVEVIGRVDECGNVVVESVERFLMGVHHVARLIAA